MKRRSFTTTILTGFALGILPVILPGCKKFLDVPAPDALADPNEIYNNEAQTSKRRASMYIDIMNAAGLLNGYLSKFASLYCDELSRGNIIDADTAFVTTNLGADNSTVEYIWTSGYRSILNANDLINGLAHSTALSLQTRVQLSADARFIRALSYFYLVNLFGKVPLVLTPDTQQSATLPRAPADDIYRQIIADLKAAQDGLPLYYGNNDSLPDSRIHATHWAATALLSRVYLYRQDWVNAAQQATDIIDNSPFRLPENLKQVFLAASKETILHFAPLPGNAYNTQEGALFLPASANAQPPCLLTNNLLNAFEPNDARRSSWVRSGTANGQPCYSPYKYKVNNSNGVYTEYNVVLRLGEQFLVRAEARARMGNLAGAINDLNTLRKRANLPNLSASLTQQQVMQAVAHERQVELFAEWGHRLFDLQRWPGTLYPGKTSLDDVLFVAKGPNWSSYKALWPIPADQIQLNGNLDQNTGY